MNKQSTGQYLLSDNKPQYVPPQITTYSTEELQKQLGPARAFSPDRSTDDDLLGLGGD